MATAKGAVRQAKRQTAAAINNEWVERLVRLGYAMRGVLYLVLGLVAAGVVLGTRSAPKDTTGAIAEIAAQPYGQFLLVVMAIGLAGYSLWGFVRAIWDPLNKGTDMSGLAARAGYLWSGIAYGTLVLPTVQFLTGRGGVSRGQTAQTQDMTSRLLHTSFGVPLVALIGLIVTAMGLYQIYYGYKAKFTSDIKLEGLPAEEKRRAIDMGRLGYGARGVVFALIGVFLVQAAVTFNPSKAQGIDGVLLKLAQQPYGVLLLGIVALGLIAFGLFSLVSARWARVM